MDEVYHVSYAALHDPTLQHMATGVRRPGRVDIGFFKKLKYPNHPSNDQYLRVEVRAG
jgi:hypothetical protein